jgi:hypothetical protein
MSKAPGAAADYDGSGQWFKIFDWGMLAQATFYAQLQRLMLSKLSGPSGTSWPLRSKSHKFTGLILNSKPGRRLVAPRSDS